MKVFIDSNIPMYVAGRDHPHKEPARAFLEKVRAGSLEACTSTEVLQEILYRYHALGRRDLAGKVYDFFTRLCPEVLSVSLAETDRARALLDEVEGVGVRDLLHAAVMLNHDVRHIATFDAGFDRILGIKRVALELVKP